MKESRLARAISRSLSPSAKRWIQRWCWPMMPGWPDEGRRIVQGPHLQSLLARAAAEAGGFRHVFNAGSGECGFSPLLFGLPKVESVIESDFGFCTLKPVRTHAMQVFFGSSLVSVPLRDNSVELVLCTEVLEHIHEDGQALDELARVTAPCGWLLITVPTPPAPPDAAHVREGYRPAELESMLAERGFELIETRFCMHFFFRFVLAHWWQLPWCPRGLIRALSGLDRVIRIGPPMDLLMLARMRSSKAAPARSQPGADGASYGSGKREEVA